MVLRQPSTVVISSDFASQLRRVVRAHGSVRAAALALGSNAETLARALAGLPLRRGSALVLQGGVAALAAPPTAGD
jgi:hypothetical protein